MATAQSKIDVNLFDMVHRPARAIDLLHPTISECRLQVASIAFCTAEERGLGVEEMQNVLTAGALRDLTALDRMAVERAIDDDIVAVLRNDFEEIHHARSLSQQLCRT